MYIKIHITCNKLVIQNVTYVSLKFFFIKFKKKFLNITDNLILIKYAAHCSVSKTLTKKSFFF